MIAHRFPARRDAPQFAAGVKEDRKEQTAFVANRFRIDPVMAEKHLGTMDLASRTMLAIEMNERAQHSWHADYDPFRETV